MEWKTIPWLKILRVVGICCGLAIIALALYSFIELDDNIELWVNDIYRVVFGVLIVIAEFQFVKLLDWFSFLCTLIGLGGFYIFVGGLALDSHPWSIAIAVVLVVVGCVYCGAGCACQDDRARAIQLKDAHEKEDVGSTVGAPAPSKIDESSSSSSKPASSAPSTSAPANTDSKPAGWPHSGGGDAWPHNMGEDA